jgi:hypothetical protein
MGEAEVRCRRLRGWPRCFGEEEQCGEPEQTLNPYLCPEAHAIEQLSDAQPLESHEVALQEDGGLESFTDFEHPLSFRCVVGGSDGSGASSAYAAPPGCPPSRV